MSAALYLCMNLRDFPAQAISRAHPELRNQALAILTGTPPLEKVFGLTRRAREQGVEAGMSRVQVESFAETMIVRRDRKQEEQAFAELLRCTEQFSPRVQATDSPEEFTSGAQFVLDISNSERLLGSPRQIAQTLLSKVRTLGYEADIAISGNAYAAVLAAVGSQGITVIATGCEAKVLAALPLTVLALDATQAETLTAWGVHTLGQLAALPLKPLIARMGQDGYRLYMMAIGSYDHLLVPEQESSDAVLVERVELEHPVELLEPLLFLMSRALEQLTLRAREHALAIASVETCLVLDDAERSEHLRTVRPALPERDYQTLLKLIQLDFELHPPSSGIVAFTMRAIPARPPKVQQGLFAAQAPESGRLEVLLARLRKLVGEGRVGQAELLDSHEPDAFRMNPFTGQTSEIKTTPHRSQTLTLRMMRPPLVVRIGMNETGPADLLLDGKHFAVETHSGPWRTNGAWWTHPSWCREEWDVVLRDVALQGQPQRCLRLAHDPSASCWYVIGIYD